ncbi:hypothetical protein [Alteromonas macleodii]|uniref:Uncharacterized protein n=1 Tax=Alteromonas macleodii TaxID=28108 RepID=A0AB36FP33_ALTMA|nr:hypothetical protein [Alteromonas macleodii]OES24151.1 hypothetical protein BFV93_4751 [Alteromonas macleodii]OES24785.1 hypothetical protein BFV95_4544 [Alteromonas macleodii]OES25063.1 hypothetical protein BFV94_4534 [Alteromonas macleodii]OES39106.1 hypothetical protein BFV96_4254 [Alteromonas macleodii]
MKNTDHHISSDVIKMRDAIAQMHLDQGIALSERFHAMMSKFRGFHDPTFNLCENEQLLADMLEFEKNVCLLDMLESFYGYIARLYLQTGNTKQCVSYALAALELLKKNGDKEGVWATYMVICDCSLANSASSIAMEYYAKASDLQSGAAMDPQIVIGIKQNPNNNAVEMRKLLKSKQRPSSLRYFKSEDTKLDEQQLRFIMVSQHVSRQTARKWKREADALFKQ